MWTVRVSQLAEHGILLDPEEIPKEPRPDLDDEYEWDFHHIGQVYMHGSGCFWLAWRSGRPVGYVGGQDVGGTIELRRLYVTASHRRLGVGVRLVRTLIDHARARAVPAIELWTAADGPGRRLYETLGFRETTGLGAEYAETTSRTRYVPSPDEIRMRLDLDE